MSHPIFNKTSEGGEGNDRAFLSISHHCNCGAIPRKTFERHVPIEYSFRMKRFASREDIKPFLNLVWSGHLFEVQDWIRDGKPVNPPLFTPKKPRVKGPLEYAMLSGFYCMVQVLLDAGANVVEPSINDPLAFRAIYHAVDDRRMDLIELLVKHGADVRDVQWETILHTWSPEIIRYCIEHGADLEDEFNPIAYGFQKKIRPVLGIYKTYEKQVPDLKRQINIALRYHTEKKNQKWASLLLWAGADPYDIGPEDYTEYTDYDRRAIGIALQDGWDWFFKQIKTLVPSEEYAANFLYAACRSDKAHMLTTLINAGFINAMNAEDSTKMLSERMIAASHSRHKGCFCVESLGLLFANGAKWTPTFEQIRDTRRSMLGGRAAGVQSVVSLLKKHKVATKEVIRELTRTPSINKLLHA
ncbi:ankyrin repeat domain-containing protein [Tichowtungia aerotolerans]|uniref:Uncharacterized protein n=1 Tax=Tichowtungia aerotolerans TaxID=2697043 RepID=A0A6P1M4L4_9BACT|nr:hypothetical protein [Tichowtungia aerotolerans]QHI68777.1 hypothetical protein GT409_04705 [Tichowtungia aerotolerans]